MSADKIDSTVVESTPLELTVDIDEWAKEKTKEVILKFDVNALEVRAGVAGLGMISVTGQEARDKAYNLAKLANKALIMIEKRRVELVSPFNDLVKAVNLYAKESLVGPLKLAIEKADKKILEWDKAEAERKKLLALELEKERLRIIQEEEAKQAKIKAEAEAEVLRLKTEAPKSRQETINAMPHGIPRILAQRALDAETNQAVAKVEATAVALATATEIDKSLALSDVRGTQEDLSVKVKGSMAVWQYEIVDLSKVHTSFLMLNPVAVNKAIKEGSRSIAGLRIFQEERLRH